MLVLLEKFADTPDITLGLGIGRNPGVAVHRAFSRVIGSGDQCDIPLEVSQQLT